jgi:glutamine phosphoribosylpyrophosphate amidotransferase
MCGVIGVYLTDVTPADCGLVSNLFLESMIRGKHATGVTFFKDGKFNTIKEPTSSYLFLGRHTTVEDWVDGDTLLCIGHTRYSTSDLRYNQPFQGKEISIAHNGVISQDPDIWEYETETLNDSELILRCIEAGDTPLEVYKHRSMACVAIEDGVLHGWRNHERPLWMAPRDNGLIFASTEDIIRRSRIEGHVEKCEPLVKYTYSNYGGLYEDRRFFDPDLEDLQ